MHILKQLRMKKGRDETGLFVVEGEKFVREIPVGWEVVRYVFSQGFVDGAAAQPERAAFIARCRGVAAVEILRDSVFASYVDTLTPQGVAAICRQRRWSRDGLWGQTLLLCESLQDPGNVGTLIRTAAAAGVSGVMLTAGSADVYSAKVQRAAAGAALRLPVIGDVVLEEVLAEVKARGMSVYAAHPHGGVAPYALDMRGAFCLLIGNEAHGLSDEALRHADAKVCLPMANATESLNAAAAGSILLYEAVRQRG